MMILIAFVGLAVDGGELAAQSRSSQSAADGAALAAGYDIMNSGYSLAQATAQGQTVALQNGIPATDLVLTYLDSTGQPTASVSSVAYVKATVTHRFATLFLPIVNIDQAQISASAEAITASAKVSCAICTLGTSGTGFNFNASGNVSVTGGSVLIDSTSSSALSLTGTGTFTAPAIGIVGGYTGNATVNPTPTTGISTVPDPYATLNLPNTPACSVVVTQNCWNNYGNQTYATNNACSGNCLVVQPGIYNNLTISNHGSATLAAGVYVITGSLTILNTGNLCAARGCGTGGVMLYLACSNYPTPCTSGGQAGATMIDTGTGSFNITGFSSDPYNQMAIMFDRSNTSGLSINFNAGSSIQGTIYAAASVLTYAPRGNIGTIDSDIIVSSILDSSNQRLIVNYVPSENFQISNQLELVQ